MRFSRRALRACVVLLGLLASAPNRTHAQDVLPHDALVIRPVGRSGRAPVHTDAIERLLVSGQWTLPKAGDAVTLADGKTTKWEALTAQKDGDFTHPALEGGYALVTVNAEAPRVAILEASGHSLVYVNGEPRVGDPYEYGYVRVPIELRAGPNALLFLCGRGHLHVKLSSPRSAGLLNVSDPTLPDLITGEKGKVWGAVIALNATNAPSGPLYLRAARPHSSPIVTALSSLPPLSLRKVGFQLDGRAPDTKANTTSGATTGTPSPNAPMPVPVELTLLHRRNGRWEPLDTAHIDLRVRTPEQTQKRTFVSEIDGSVQYYAINPSVPRPRNAESRALFLSLHGASVEAIGQADAYSSKSWGDIVAPTNRRPYGFDWEDWGRLDALEVLALAEQRLHPDPQRIYLTGHSMGGHGTWQIGVTFPDHFAAIGPSAGWISFFSYAGGTREAHPTPMQAMLQRAVSPSDTLALEHNYASEGVYILHGSADDNVPPTEARTMNQRLAAFHHDFTYFEQPGAGHWWDVSDEPGADCVDWAPLFDFFAHHALPNDADTRQVDFTTASPGVSARCHWASIEMQTHPLEVSTVHLRCDPGQRRFVGTTGNVARLALSVGHLPPGTPLRVELDGQKLENIPYPTGTPTLWLTRTGETWAVGAQPSPALKNPQRYGPFKQAFQHRMLFVYGTQGTPEENAWAFAKARFDAETFWYRGNGSPEVLADTEFDATKEPERSVILYGNADTNSAWKSLLADSPIQMKRGEIRLGTRSVTGNDLASLFLRPRPGSRTACVGVVGGSGLAGMRLTDRLPYFLSGVAYPDCTVFGPEILTQGSAGVRAAGFFGEDWSVERGEFAWNTAGEH